LSYYYILFSKELGENHVFVDTRAIAQLSD
jgi:hypothetical protein